MARTPTAAPEVSKRPSDKGSAFAGFLRNLGGQSMDTPTPLPATLHTPAQCEAKLAAATVTFSLWRKTPMEQRAKALTQLADLMEEEAGELARLITTEMGKPLAAAEAEVRKCASVCRFYAQEGARFLAPEEMDGPAKRNLIRYEPLGPVLAVMPWNFPFWQVFRFAAPAVMAGNVALLKHASNVPGCALAIERLFEQAGFPHGVFTTFLIPASKVAAIIHDRRVAAVTLTGSVEAGRKVAAEAGAALKKCVLELGGSDPFVILPSADFPAAVAAAVKARTINNGQSCIAAKRFLIHESIYEETQAAIVAGMQRLVVGDPFDPSTDIGPLATVAIADEVAAQVEASLAAGAQLLCGGERGPGSFYPPTVLASIPPEAPAWREEIFGPVALLFKVRDLDHAIALANDTPFGLGAAAWTRDSKEADRLVAEIEAGAVFINGIVASDPRLPFGGIRDSGYGRELGCFGIREFVNIKTVCASE